MRSSDERVEALHSRMKGLRAAKFRRRCRLIGASAVIGCLAVSLLIAVGVFRSALQTSGEFAFGATASVFTNRAELGFAVAALAAFCLGALVTILCHRLKKRMEREEQSGN